MKHRRGLAALALVATILFGVVPAARATSVVAPNANTGVEANQDTLAPFHASALTFQWVFAAAQFSAVPLGSSITEIGFRLDGGAPNAGAFTMGSWDLQLSRSLNAPGALSATFADNIGADVVLVHSGLLAVPAGTFLGGPGPNPFGEIAFTTPYTYTGGDLLVTLRDTGGGPSLSFDAVSLPNSVTDSMGTVGDATSTIAIQQHFFNVPVTEFVFASAAAVPEPSSLWLVAGGVLTALACACWRRRRGPRSTV